MTLEMIKRECYEEGYKEGYEEGFKEGYMESLVKFVQKGYLSISQAALKAKVTEEEFIEFMSEQ